MIVKADGWFVHEHPLNGGTTRPVEFFAFLPVGVPGGMSLKAIALVLVDGELTASNGKLSKTRHIAEGL